MAGGSKEAMCVSQIHITANLFLPSQSYNHHLQNLVPISNCGYPASSQETVFYRAANQGGPDHHALQTMT